LISSRETLAWSSTFLSESSVGPLAPFSTIPNAIETLNGEMNTFLPGSELLTLVNKLNPKELPEAITDRSVVVSSSGGD
jgi:hypothetical protein